MISIVSALESNNGDYKANIYIGSTGGYNYSVNNTNISYGSGQIIIYNDSSIDYNQQSGIMYISASVPVTEEELPPDIYITNCTNLDQNGKTYYLIGNIIDSANSSCMNISANNLTLDCLGNVIDGDEGQEYGIHVYRSSSQETNITIRNCNLTDWLLSALLIENADNNVVENINIPSTLTRGIYLLNSDNNNLTNSYLNQSVNLGSVLLIKYSNDNLVDNLTITEGSYGIRLINSTGNVIQNSLIANNSISDVYLNQFKNSYSCENSLININGTDNKPIILFNQSVNIQNWNNNASQILLCKANNSVIHNLTLMRTDEQNNGLSILDSNSVNITNSNFTNLNHGIYLASSDSNIIKNNTFDSNQDGIYLYGFNNQNLIVNNTIIGNSYGIEVYHISNDNNNIYNNLFNNTVNIRFIQEAENYWNTTNQSGTRIFSSGLQIGGNYWTNASGDGYSDTCTDSNMTGFCEPLNITNMKPCNASTCGNNVDYLPLSDKYSIGGDTCTHTPSQNWNIDGTDYCNITTKNNIGNYNVTCYDGGIVRFYQNITEFNYFFITGGCTVLMLNNSFLGG